LPVVRAGAVSRPMRSYQRIVSILVLVVRASSPMLNVSAIAMAASP
jgi:hypothetical protein